MTKKKTSILIIILALLATAVVGRNHISNLFSRDKTDTAASTKAEVQKAAQVDANTKKDLVQNEKPTGNTSNPDTTTAASPTIDLSARSESNGTVTVFTKLFSVSGGSCTLEVSNGAKQNRQTAMVVYQPEYSSCAGFSVPVSELGTGNWSINLTVNSNGQGYSKVINYEVR